MSVEVFNTGDHGGEEVVQLYVRGKILSPHLSYPHFIVHLDQVLPHKFFSPHLGQLWPK